jgi:hypothetical protein
MDVYEHQSNRQATGLVLQSSKVIRRHNVYRISSQLVQLAIGHSFGRVGILEGMDFESLFWIERKIAALYEKSGE